MTEQPLKIPFIAGLVLALNQQKADIAQNILRRAASELQKYLRAGAWREVKLMLRFVACMHQLLEGNGLFRIFEELFARAVDLQTASSEDVSKHVNGERCIADALLATRVSVSSLSKSYS